MQAVAAGAVKVLQYKQPAKLIECLLKPGGIFY